MFRRYFGLAVALILGAALLAGCGGSGDNAGNAGQPAGENDQAQVEALVKKLGRFTQKQNAKGICGLFEPERMRAWVGDNCVKIFRQGLRVKPDASLYDIKEIRMDGDSAVAILGFGEVQLSRIDGQWYLDTPEATLPEND